MLWTLCLYIRSAPYHVGDGALQRCVAGMGNGHQGLGGAIRVMSASAPLALLIRSNSYERAMLVADGVEVPGWVK